MRLFKSTTISLVLLCGQTWNVQASQSIISTLLALQGSRGRDSIHTGISLMLGTSPLPLAVSLVSLQVFEMPCTCPIYLSIFPRDICIECLVSHDSRAWTHLVLLSHDSAYHAYHKTSVFNLLAWPHTCQDGWPGTPPPLLGLEVRS